MHCDMILDCVMICYIFIRMYKCLNPRMLKYITCNDFYIGCSDVTDCYGARKGIILILYEFNLFTCLVMMITCLEGSLHDDVHSA